MKLLLELPASPTPSTALINEAIERLATRGGGTVQIPPGRFLTGTIFLRSNISLELAAGAVLTASADISEYPPLPLNAGFPEHLRKGENPQRRHLLVAEEAENVTLCGQGIIDGNMAAFAPGWELRNEFAWTDPSRRFFVPTLEFLRCRNVRIRGVVIRDSPGWTCHLCLCDEVRVEGVTLLNHLYAGNSDGFDVDGCHDVWFSRCRIETGDDCIVMKSNPLTRSCERIIISDCMLRSTCAAVKIGTESWWDFRSIQFTNSIVHGSNRAFQISCLDGATVEDVLVDGLQIDTDSTNIFNRPIHLDLGLRRSGFLKGRENERRLGKIRRVSISNLSIRTDGRLLLTAGDGGRLEDVSLCNLRLAYPSIEDPAASKGADLLQGSSNCPEAVETSAAIVAQNIDRLDLSNVSVSWPDPASAESFRPKYRDGEVAKGVTIHSRRPPHFEIFRGIDLQDDRVELAAFERP
jgi:hypothetical protein